MTEIIPEAEYENFRSFIREYHKGESIITEGQQDDNSLFLLRIGEVEIYKDNGEKRDLISKIEAINFFGEMAIISGGPRSATVVALSNIVIVYAFRSPDLGALMSNPKWGNMLVSRLSKNLNRSNEQLVELRLENQKLKTSNEKLSKGIVEIFSVTNEIQKSIARDAVATAREWTYLNAIVELSQCMLKSRLPELAQQIKGVDSSLWKTLYEEGVCSEIIYDYIKNKIKTLNDH